MLFHPLLLLLSNIYCCQHNFLASPLPYVFLTYPVEFLQSFNCSSLPAFTFFKKKEKVPGEKWLAFSLKKKKELKKKKLREDH